MKRSMIGLTAAMAMVTGCGGGGSDDGAPQSNAAGTAQGLWVGTTNNNRQMTSLVFSDGSYYVLYTAANAPNVIAGVVQGSGISSAGTFSSSNARDFNLEGLGVNSATVSANYVQKQSFNGSIGFGNSSVNFTSNYSTDFELTPTLANLSGTYTGQVALSQGIQNATVTVSSTGAITGGGNGCSLTGSATPRADGNAFNLSITFGPSPCFFPNQTFTGMGYYSARTKQLYAAAPNATRTDGVLFVGIKP
jgi:hypothetical protein